MSKNKFLEQFIEIPDKGTIRFFVFGAALLVNIINSMVAYLFESLFHIPVFGNEYLMVLVLFDIWALSIFAFPKKLSKQIFLYIAVAFTGSSLYYLYIANTMIYLEFGTKSVFYIILSLLIYILMVTTVILNIVSKIKKRKQYIINNRNTAIVAFLGAAVGVFLPKPVSLHQTKLPLIIVLLLLSYLFTFTCSGFYKFYLNNKINKLNNS